MYKAVENLLKISENRENKSPLCLLSNRCPFDFVYSETKKIFWSLSAKGTIEPESHNEVAECRWSPAVTEYSSLQRAQVAGSSSESHRTIAPCAEPRIEARSNCAETQWGYTHDQTSGFAYLHRLTFDIQCCTLHT